MDKHSCPEPGTVVEDRPLEGMEKDLVTRMMSSMIRPDAVVEGVVAGPKFMALKAGGRTGLSSLLGAAPRDGEGQITKEIVGKPVKDAARYLESPSPFLISLGAAAMNAANCPEPGGETPGDFPAEALIVEYGKGRDVGLVGAFPFTKEIAGKVGRFHLFELQPVKGALPREKWEETLSGLDVLALTGTALLTRHMAWYLTRASRARIIILGPTTPFSRTLFEQGADHLCGSVVTDFEKVAEGIRAGLPFSRIKKRGGVVFTRWDGRD